MSTPTQIRDVNRVSGNTIRSYWRNPVDVVTTSDGKFIAEPAQGFSDRIGYSPMAYTTRHEGLDYIWMEN